MTDSLFITLYLLGVTVISSLVCYYCFIIGFSRHPTIKYVDIIEDGEMEIYRDYDDSGSTVVKVRESLTDGSYVIYAMPTKHKWKGVMVRHAENYLKGLGKDYKVEYVGVKKDNIRCKIKTSNGFTFKYYEEDIGVDK